MSLLVVGIVVFDDIEMFFGWVEMVVGGVVIYIVLVVFYYIRNIKIVFVVGDDFFEVDLDDLCVCGVDLVGL